MTGGEVLHDQAENEGLIRNHSRSSVLCTVMKLSPENTRYAFDFKQAFGQYTDASMVSKCAEPPSTVSRCTSVAGLGSIQSG